MDASTVTWITDYLTNRPQYERLNGCVSDQVVSSTTGDCALTSPLPSVHLRLPVQSESCHLQKYSDDSAVVECISDGQETEYRQLVDCFVAWCGNNHLILNVNDTKKMIVDFRRARNKSSSISIMREKVEEYKFLGVQLDNRLDWRCNTDVVYQKGKSRFYFFRKLWSFSVCSKMFHIFCQFVVNSAILSAITCWENCIRASDIKKLNKLMRKDGSAPETALEPLELILQRSILNKMKNMMDNPEHLDTKHSVSATVQSEASSDPLQHRPLQEILSACSFNLRQLIIEET